MNIFFTLQRRPIIIPRDYTATNLEEEHRIAYWREDIGINLHHWHWHLVYPFTSSNRAIVAKDRRGELFFYMHQQIIARYVPKQLDIHIFQCVGRCMHIIMREINPVRRTSETNLFNSDYR